MLAAAATLAASAAAPALAGALPGRAAEEDSAGAVLDPFVGVSTRILPEGADVKTRADISARINERSMSRGGEAGGLERSDAVGLAIGLQGRDEAKTRPNH
ncbi:MAG TPA: hypothetical protein VFO18_18970 [Methylomirabilota bacterium]|nr:hypothetical protein [Methylomirabilota bacterium]